jgi:hypothetical protein
VGAVCSVSSQLCSGTPPNPWAKGICFLADALMCSLIQSLGCTTACQRSCTCAQPNGQCGTDFLTPCGNTCCQLPTPYCVNSATGQCSSCPPGEIPDAKGDCQRIQCSMYSQPCAECDQTDSICKYFNQLPCPDNTCCPLNQQCCPPFGEGKYQCCYGLCAGEGGGCPSERACGGTCCPMGQACCARCIDVLSDPSNCGS